MQTFSTEEMQKQNQELKELLLKLNQDKQMFEKKVQRKTQELQKLKQQYDTLSEKILTQKHQVPNATDLELDQLLLTILDSLIGQQIQEGQCEQCKQLQKEIQQIQEQQKLDMYYYSKKIKQNEELLSDIRGKHEGQLKELNDQNQILLHKLEFLVGKTIFYHEAILDLNQQVSEVSYLRISLQENQRKVEEDLVNKNQQKMAQFEARNNFLIEQVRGMEQELMSLEKLVTNIEQLTMQTKKRGK